VCLFQVRYLSFNIGSVEVLEKNLIQAQKDLGVLPSHYVPVTYKTETDYVKTLILPSIPTVLFLVLMVLGIKRMTSGGKSNMVGGEGGCGMGGWDRLCEGRCAVLFQLSGRRFIWNGKHCQIHQQGD